MRRRLSLAGAAAALGLLTLSGCGSENSTAVDPVDGSADTATSTDTATPTPSETADGAATPTTPSATAFDLPACDAVWVEGSKLSGDYEGCLAADGSPVDGAGRYCEFGKPIFTYGRHYYAVPNGPVIRTDAALSKDDRFQRAQRSCAG